MKTIYAAIYEHPDRTDVRVFEDEDDAWAWRTQLAKDCWHDAFEETPPSDADIGAEYFLRMADEPEYFFVYPCELEPHAAQYFPAPGGVRALPAFSQPQEPLLRKAEHFETLLGILKILAKPPGDPTFDLDFWRARANAAVAKADAILAGAPDPG